jgi:SAM-dependent methyltransferase
MLKSRNTVLESIIRIGRVVLQQRVKPIQLFHYAVEGKNGLEIGGPSGVFRDTGIIPIYRYVGNLDNCVFARTTTWEGDREEGRLFHYYPAKPCGFNFIREATSLTGISNQVYDFILSAHNLEHIANPVLALKEWTRVLKPGGFLIVILPDYRRTFDHFRKPTAVAHMMEDYDQGTEETDLTHLPEILELHDLNRDRAAGTREQFRERSLRNFKNRCLHHHVFDERNSRELLESVGLSVRVVEILRPHHIVLLAQTPDSGHESYQISIQR